MMQTYDLTSWDEFRPLLQTLRERYGAHQSTGYNLTNTLLFRGIADSDWPLSTTLERFSDDEFTVNKYIHYAALCCHQIESFTGRKWNVPDYEVLEQEIENKQDSCSPYLPNYDYLVYLRHHGFPSPLLDWTTSPYVAAYFAYWETRCEPHRSDRIAIYCYIATPNGTKSWCGTPPLIHPLGPYVSTHSRHFAQKAQYTYTTQWDKTRKKHIFRHHSLVFEKGNEHQDMLIKISIPYNDRINALRELNEYNIDHFTLFQTEDALMQALALKEFKLDDTASASS